MLRHPVAFRHGSHNSLALVRSHFARYGLLDDQVHFAQGIFSKTLPDLPTDCLAVLRLDGDTYESTRDSLELLFHRLSTGGFCIVDDYHAFPDCRKAIDEFRELHGINDALMAIDRFSVYWRKS
ncbi:MAG: TylF/MycF/NovP-related O-methyltransferase [Verrucomicrobiota bacterium]